MIEGIADQLLCVSDVVNCSCVCFLSAKVTAACGLAEGFSEQDVTVSVQQDQPQQEQLQVPQQKQLLKQQENPPLRSTKPLQMTSPLKNFDALKESLDADSTCYFILKS